MLLKKSRILSLNQYLDNINDGENFYIGFFDLKETVKILNSGLSSEMLLNEQVLPTARGPIARFNANGSFHKHKELPKETIFRERWLKDWHGNHHTVDIPYKRYKRSIIHPPSIEIQIIQNQLGEKMICSPKFTKGETDNRIILHTINLFLELFGECEILNSTLIPEINLPVNRLNWEIFKGEYSREQILTIISDLTNNINNNNQKLVKQRLGIISSLNPNFCAVGKAGFRGYIVFGFPNKNFYLLESLYTGQATYILGANWELISQLSKYQIITQSLQEERIIHNRTWEKTLKIYFDSHN